MVDYQGNVAGQGLNTILSVGLEESAYGTAADAEMHTGLADEVNLGEEDQLYEGRGITNTRTLTNLTTIARKYPVSIRGKVESGVPFAMIGGFIQNAAKDAVHAANVTDPFISVMRGASHTTPSQVYLPSWTIGRTFDDETDYIRVLGTTFDTGTFSCDLDGPWSYDLSGIGQSSDIDTSVSGVAVGGFPLGSWNTTVKCDPNGTTSFVDDAGSLAMYGLKNIAFSVNNNLRTRNEFGSTAPVSIRQSKFGQSNIELRLTRGYIDNDLWALIVAGTAMSFEAETTDGTCTITHEFDLCRFKTLQQSTGLDDETVETAVLTVKDWNCVSTADGITYVAWD